jgi:hypothetical protein
VKSWSATAAAPSPKAGRRASFSASGHGEIRLLEQFRPNHAGNAIPGRLQSQIRIGDLELIGKGQGRGGAKLVSRAELAAEKGGTAIPFGVAVDDALFDHSLHAFGQGVLSAEQV